MADIMVMPGREYRGKSYRYALIVCRTFFSRTSPAALSSTRRYRPSERLQADVLKERGGHPPILLTDGRSGFETPGYTRGLSGENPP
jgi:hypothetical protein